MALYSLTVHRELDGIDFNSSFGSSENTSGAGKLNVASSPRSDDSFTFSEDDFDVILAAERSKRPLSHVSSTQSSNSTLCKRVAPSSTDARSAPVLDPPYAKPISSTPYSSQLSNNGLASLMNHDNNLSSNVSPSDTITARVLPDRVIPILSRSTTILPQISPNRIKSILPTRMPGSTGLSSPAKGRNSFIPPRPMLKPTNENVVTAPSIKSEIDSLGDITSRIPAYSFKTFEPPKSILVNIPGHSQQSQTQNTSTRDAASPITATSTSTNDLARFAYLSPGFVKSESVNLHGVPDASLFNSTLSTSHVACAVAGDPVVPDIGTLKLPKFIPPAPAVKLPLFSDLFGFSDPASVIQNLKLARMYSTSAPKSSKASADAYPSIQLATQKPETTRLQDPTALKTVKPIILSAEQEYVLRQALNGTSLFFTGSAGTGKSVLLRQIIKALKAKHSEVAVTASTGLAACNIGGMTLHSFAGVGLGAEEVSVLFKRLRRNRKAFNRWHTTKVLVIDEVSMVDGHFLNKLDAIGKKVRKNQRPFGGIQIIMCGDFYQLPPVVKNTAPDGSELSTPAEAFFAFESEAWKECVSQTIILEEVFRQKGDQVFIDMLNELRNGNVSNVTAHNFAALLRPLICPQGIVPAELFATRLEVDRANNTRLNQIKGPAKVYTSIDTGILPQPQLLNVLSNFLAPPRLFLKVGAQVMCVKNYDETLVNGSLGQVIDFVDKNTYMKGLEADGVLPDEKMCTSDYVFDKKDKKSKSKEESKAPGLLAMAKAKETSDSRKQALGEDIKNDTTQKLHPLVKFLLPDGVNTRTVLVEPEQWTVEDEKQVVLASRVQLPLILAWSLSIHKSQGQTLPKVKVDLKNVFETGQSYVALSRAVSRTGLQVLNFNASRVRSHPRVKEFYRTLEPAAEAMKKPRGQIKLNFARA